MVFTLVSAIQDKLADLAEAISIFNKEEAERVLREAEEAEQVGTIENLIC